jgi:hypothetical protein
MYKLKKKVTTKIFETPQSKKKTSKNLLTEQIDTQKNNKAQKQM